MEYQSIIVRMPNWIGDLVMATPVLQDLRNAYPHATITAMCRRPISDLLIHDPNINELFCFSKLNHWTRREHLRNVVRKLRNGHYDLGILLPNSFSSAWLFWRGKVKRRIGFAANYRSWFLSDALPFPQARQSQHLVLTYKELLRPLDILPTESVPYLTVTPSEIAQGWALLARFGIQKGDRLIGINPGAAYGSAKCWLPERFKEVSQKLLKWQGRFKLLFFGDQSHEELVRHICQGLPEEAVNLAGLTTLRELMALISMCEVLLTNDSGPMHIAAALGTPLVALFGSTDDVVTGPYQGGRVIHKRVSCSPCFQRVCPLDFRCMKEIQTEEVLEEIKSLVNEDV